MFIKDLKNCEEFVAGDSTILRELLHPDKAGLKLKFLCIVDSAWRTEDEEVL